eukprot:TRINITY_DN11049_c0_g1_i9.p2 TRINITY_DN11049_c0_g1~~TRINITY_DN11049_c0_g1_i9.p2  ORF type:complete len:103 (-),score=12.21 TRINITY_DN11049_c0_g1_i9:286-594(-)
MPAKGSKKVGGKWVKPAVQRVAKPAPKSRKRQAARHLVPLTAYYGWQRLVMTRGVATDLNPTGSVMQAIRDQVRAHLRTSAPLSCASGARGRLTSLTTVPMM